MTVNDAVKFLGDKIVSLSPEHVFYSDPVSGRKQILPASVARVATTCTRFDTITNHAERLRSLCAGSNLASQDWISSLVEARDLGLLTAAESVRELLYGHLPIGKQRRSIRHIGIPTRNRPEILERLLGQFSIKDSDISPPRITVMDGSDVASTRARNQEIVKRARSSLACEVRYGDQNSRACYLARLAKECEVDEDLLAFGFSGELKGVTNTGAVRNALLLEGAGQPLLFIDDDVQCRSTPIPGSENQIKWGASKADFETWFFSSFEDIGRFKPEPDSLVTLHENAFNLPGLPDLRSQDDSQFSEVEDVSVRLINYLRRSRGASVIVSGCGVLGDPGIDSPLPFLLGGPSTIERLLADERTFREATHNRIVLQGPTRLLVSESMGCMTYCLAVDNTAILPPFLPIYRTEDYVFSALVQQCIPGALFAISPRAVLHTPAEERRFPPNSIVQNIGQFAAGEIIAALIRKTEISLPASDSSLRAMGSRLSDLADQDEVGFHAILQATMQPLLVQWIQVLENILHFYAPHASDYRTVFRQSETKILRILNEPQPLIPSDMVGAGTPQESLVRFQRLVHRFGQFLQSWPDIVSANQRLQSQGVSISYAP